ncbi:MAG: glycosyltransferase family 4 protein, partial [Microthrixaceae bacterium]
MSDSIRVAMTLTQDWHKVPGGTAVAANELAAELHAMDGIDLVAVLAPGSPTVGYEPDVPGVRMRPGPPLLYDAWTMLRRPKVTSVVPDAQVVHSTIPIAVPRETVPVVSSVHDLLPLTMPEAFTGRGARIMRRGLERIRSESAMVIVPSELGASEFRSHGFDGARLRVVPLGVRPVDPPPGAEVDRVLRGLGLSGPYVLFVGTEEPRKGLDVLSEAMRRLDRPGLTLAVAGPAGWGESGLDPELGGGGGGMRMKRLGYLSDFDLRCVRSGAAVCALPSRAEGFGLPALEALAGGVPLVTTAGTPMEEVAGSAARLVPAGDSEALAEAIADVLDDARLAERMTAAGIERAR